MIKKFIAVTIGDIKGIGIQLLIDLIIQKKYVISFYLLTIILSKNIQIKIKLKLKQLILKIMKKNY